MADQSESVFEHLARAARLEGGHAHSRLRLVYHVRNMRVWAVLRIEMKYNEASDTECPLHWKLGDAVCVARWTLAVGRGAHVGDKVHVGT